MDLGARGRGRRSRVGIALVLLSGMISGCRNEGAPPKIALAIYAAASLTEAFSALEPAFEAAHPEFDVRLTFAGSQVLRLQIEEGAKAAVFASADPRLTARLVETGRLQGVEVFAHNQLRVIVPIKNPAGLKTFEDLVHARRLVIGTEHVPIGVYTRQVLQRAEARYGAAFGRTVRSRVVSEESNVRLVRAKVELEEADAALVYATDAISSNRVRSIPIPEGLGVEADYAMGMVTESGRERAAETWVTFVRSTAGQAILKKFGFTGVR